MRSCCTIPRPSTSTPESAEQLGVLCGPLGHRCGGTARQFGDQVVGVLWVGDGVFDLVEIPRRVRTEGLLEGRFGFGPVALLIAHRYADPETDLLGDLCAGQRLRSGDRIHPHEV